MTWNKILITACCVAAGLAATVAFAEEKPFRLIGAGVVMATQPYRGVDTTTMAVPVVVWEQKNFYIKGIETGYHVYNQGMWQLDVLTAPRFMGYHSSDSPALNGMEDRRDSWDAGMRVTAMLGAVDLSARVTHDILGRNKGGEAEVAVQKKIKGKIFQLTPSAGVRFQSRDMTNYYYGVKSGEVGLDRAAYDPGHTLNYFGDVMFNFGLSPDWIVVTRAGVESLGNPVRKSPIVNKDQVFSGVVGLTRRF